MLIREDNPYTNKTAIYTYDENCNLISKKRYPYTTNAVITEAMLSEEILTYHSLTEVWTNRLKTYNGQTVTYPTETSLYPSNYLGWNMTWSGNNLTGMSKTGMNISYSYDSNGLRTSKTVNGVTTTYYYDNGLLIRQKSSTDDIWFIYDDCGEIAGLTWNGVTYFYEYDMLGNVEAIQISSWNTVVCYYYEAWGRVIATTTATGSETLGYINPIRYKGYYYDEETKLYYLNSRYYDPVTSRFISPDDTEVTVNLGSSLIGGLNLYLYCGNDPVNMTDSTGYILDYLLDAVFLMWSLKDVIEDPTDWKNWVALGIDAAFAVIPFVPSGAGKIYKAGDNALNLLSAANKIDNFHDLSKITIVGETMNRVGWIANGYNAADNLYDGFNAYVKMADLGKAGKVGAEVVGKVQNAGWLLNKLRTGYNIIDTGFDVFRAGRSSSYAMERVILKLWKTRNIWKLPLNYYL